VALDGAEEEGAAVAIADAIAGSVRLTVRRGPTMPSATQARATGVPKPTMATWGG